MGLLALMFKNALPIQNKVNKVFQMKQIFEEGVKKISTLKEIMFAAGQTTVTFNKYFLSWHPSLSYLSPSTSLISFLLLFLSLDLV